ncbi:MAG: right-handed parallel beta-helix repeat-containing protein [Candidatus Limnocylindrales bacterium]
MPSSINATGSSDASAALNSFISTVPNGSVVSFPAGGTFLLNSPLDAEGSNLVFEGNGATLKSSGGYAYTSSLFIATGADITIRDFSLVGASPTPGVYTPNEEQAYGVYAYGATDLEIDDVTISGVYGDGVDVDDWSNGVWFHDSHVVSCGRMGFAILAGQNVLVQRDAFDTVGYGLFDIEPWETSGGANHVQFLDNTAGTIGMPRGQGFFFGANGASGSSISDVTVSSNTISGYSLDTYVTVATRQNIVFTNNTSTAAAVAGPVLTFANVDGLTVTGNIQPLASGSLASITYCTGVTYP